MRWAAVGLIVFLCTLFSLRVLGLRRDSCEAVTRGQRNKDRRQLEYLAPQSRLWTGEFFEYAALGAHHDRAHAGHWAALQHAEITKVHRRGFTALPMLSGLPTVEVNDLQLPPGGGERPGCVNTNRVEVYINAEVKLHLRLKDNLTDDEDLMKPLLPDTEAKCKRVKHPDEEELLASSTVVLCHDLPEHTYFSLEIEWLDSNNSPMARQWTVSTADAVSGDVRGSAFFLPGDYGENPMNKTTVINAEDRLEEWEFTIFDLAYNGATSPVDLEKKCQAYKLMDHSSLFEAIGSQFDIRTNGFELVDSTEALRNHVGKFTKLFEADAAAGKK